MALKKETIEKIKAFGFDVDKLIEAVKAEAEVDYAVPEEVEVLKKTDLEARDANKMAEGKRVGETEGEKKGKELAAKAFKKKFSIEDETKDIDKVVELVSAKVATGDVGLKSQVDALLKDKEALTTQLTGEQTKAKQAQFESQLISFFPPNRSADLRDAERLQLLKMDLTFEEADGKTVVKRNGQVLQHKDTHAPLPVNQVITDYFTERKWVAAGTGEGGRGGGDNPGGGGGAGIKKMSQAQDTWKKENPNGNVISPEFTAYVNKLAKDVPDFDMYN